MEILQNAPVWVLAVAIFLLRVADVSLGTVRTISVVQGRTVLSVLLGFVEVLVWVYAVSEVINRLHEQPLLMFAYAGGFAAGNAVGIALDRRLALGVSVVRMITSHHGQQIADRLREGGQKVTTFEGRGRDGVRTLLYAVCLRRKVPQVVAWARDVDPNVVHVVEAATESHGNAPLPHPTGWRAIRKKK